MRIDMRSLLSGETDKIILNHTFSLTGRDSEDGKFTDGSFPFDTQIDGVVFTKPVHVTGEIVDTGGYIRLTAQACVEYDAECARCLGKVHRDFTLMFERTVVNGGSLENTAEDDTDDYIEIENGGIEIETVIAEELIMEFPTREFCRDDCKGLCSKCGKDLNVGECGCPKKEIDPRLAILQKLLEKS